MCAHTKGKWGKGLARGTDGQRVWYTVRDERDARASVPPLSHHHPIITGIVTARNDWHAILVRVMRGGGEVTCGAIIQQPLHGRLVTDASRDRSAHRHAAEDAWCEDTSAEDGRAEDGWGEDVRGSIPGRRRSRNSSRCRRRRGNSMSGGGVRG